jgi:soluble lytic murein transglycosylase-like protein
VTKAIPAATDATPRLRKVCEQFETMFLSQLLKENLKKISSLKGSTPGGGLYGSLAADAFSTALAAGGGIGIADMLLNQLQGHQATGSNPGARRSAIPFPGTVTDNTVLGRLKAIDPVISNIARSLGVAGNWVRAIIVQESNVRPTALSSKGAGGLMQLMRETADEMGVKNRFDIADNIRGGATYFTKLLKQFGGNHELALAAYNAGPGAVSRHGGIPPYRETEQYVREVIQKKQELDEIYASEST